MDVDSGAASESPRELYVGPEAAGALRTAAGSMASWDLSGRQLCDLELLLSGAFSPLTGFLGQADHESVVRDMRLRSGALWPLPVTLDVTAAFASRVEVGDQVALRDPEGVLLAVLSVSDKWEPDREAEARAVFGTSDTAHPGVYALRAGVNPVSLGGRVEGVEAPTHYDFRHLRTTPRALREQFLELGWREVLAFHTRRPLPRAEWDALREAAAEQGAGLLLHPAVGGEPAGAEDHFARVRSYQDLLADAPEHAALLRLVPLAPRRAGPREALLHAIVRRSHGCTHFLVGLDHAGAGLRSDGAPWYSPEAAQELCQAHAEEMGIRIVPFSGGVSGTEPLAGGLGRGEGRPPAKQGFAVFLTGLSGSGKSTIANVLRIKLKERGGRLVTLLDGDLVRKHLSSELTFSKEHRDLNIRRIGWVAAEIVKHGGIALCAPIAPYAATRRAVRDMIEPRGGFFEVHVATPLAVCEARDRKGLYALARAGKIEAFTGISDPYDVPEHPELRIDTQERSPEEAADEILLRLEADGFLA